jgi:hypothetical protein
MLWDTAKFTNLIDGCFCICLTATPDNNDKKGAHYLVIELLGFSRHDYAFGDEAEKYSLALKVDAVDAPTT